MSKAQADIKAFNAPRILEAVKASKHNMTMEALSIIAKDMAAAVKAVKAVVGDCEAMGDAIYEVCAGVPYCLRVYLINTKRK